MSERIIGNIEAKTSLDMGRLEREIDEVLTEWLEDNEEPMYRHSGTELFIDAMDMTCGDVRNVSSFELTEYVDVTLWED